MAGQSMQTIQLARGTRQFVPVAPGMLIVVARGAVRLRPPPGWLSDADHNLARRLDAEHCFEASTGGHVELAAIESTEVLLIAPEPFLARLKKLARELYRATCARRA